MKVTKAQAQANRARIVETASVLFRERGYDGVGIAELMAAAGLTHGGFYKHFQSKCQLVDEATACSTAQIAAQMQGVDAAEFVRRYVSREHRDSRTNGCTMAALGGDAARQPEAIRARFAAGIEALLAAMQCQSGADAHLPRDQALSMLAHAVGAIVMSRACPDDSPLADEILAACSSIILDALVKRPTESPG